MISLFTLLKKQWMSGLRIMPKLSLKTMISSPGIWPALCTDLALFAVKCVNGNSVFLQVGSEPKLCMTRHRAVLFPVLFLILVLQWPSSILLLGCSKMVCGKSAIYTIYNYNILIKKKNVSIWALWHFYGLRSWRFPENQGFTLQ